MFCKKDILRNLTKFTGKNLCQRLLFNKITNLVCNFIKKETLAQLFSCEFRAICKNTLSTEHLMTTASLSCQFLEACAEIVKKVYVDIVTDTTVNSPDKKQNQTKKQSLTWLCRALSKNKGV